MALGALAHWFKTKQDIYIALTAPVIVLTAAKLISNILLTVIYTGSPTPLQILRAPSQRVPSNGEGDEEIPYPLDALPGGRNVDTPYGNTRAYEWGPVCGRKVLFVHGISTPCIALARLANALVAEGCRVMLYDLPGRGYSDVPDPSVVRQDMGLFSLQILSVLASSELDWVSGFSLVGYSLGGGIAASFTSYYPMLVKSLVLIGPGGILRPISTTWSSKLLYGGLLLPDGLVNYLISRKLRAAGVVKSNVRTPSGRVDITGVVAEELPNEQQRAHAQDSSSPLFEDKPSISAATAVAWQLNHHTGFVPSFVSSVRWAPIHECHERWKLIGERCKGKREGLDCSAQSRGLSEGKVLVMLGVQDNVISSEEIAEDALRVLGKDNVEIAKLQGGHDIPLANMEGCVESIINFWKGPAK